MSCLLAICQHTLQTRVTLQCNWIWTAVWHVPQNGAVSEAQSQSLRCQKWTCQTESPTFGITVIYMQCLCWRPLIISWSLPPVFLTCNRPFYSVTLSFLSCYFLHIGYVPCENSVRQLCLQDFMLELFEKASCGVGCWIEKKLTDASRHWVGC